MASLYSDLRDNTKKALLWGPMSRKGAVWVMAAGCAMIAWSAFGGLIWSWPSSISGHFAMALLGLALVSEGIGNGALSARPGRGAGLLAASRVCSFLLLLFALSMLLVTGGSSVD